MVEFDHGFGAPLQMRITDLVAGERVTWRWLGPRLGYSESGADATIVNFSHSGWRDDSRWYAFCNLGWGATLAGLEQYCETGVQP